MKPIQLLTIIGIDLGKEAMSLRYYDIKNSLGDTYYRKHFEHWSTNDRQISLWSEPKKMAAIIDFKRLVFSLENNTDLSEILGVAKNVTHDFFTQLEIKKAQRIGCRVVSIVPVKEDFDSLRNKLQTNFYPSSEKLHAIAGKEFADVAFIVDFNKYGFYNHIALGPVRDQEVKEKLKGSANFLEDVEIPPVSLFIDIDVSRKDFDFAAFDSFFKDAPTTASKLAQEFSEFALA